MGGTIKPWWAARWETVEPEPEEPVYTDEEPCYNEPTMNEILDFEGNNEFNWT
ncbi:hypothetical protein STP4a_071 [Salmonella phage STP4-a]|uniref:Uncharacterized protein n=2 Tax=Gelderlandvirus TaxID=1913653 RepID=A0A0B4L9G4_9CAUD|nr:hypothetical protein STP4a_071 [Salmonella phage STP4-a]YP_009286433.1 hypothetical protein BI049_gp067 [Salmonella phage vB_SnwM_CGG4-1]AHJ86926.1 hypothetical protein STP4a_071 [Salmonella phage STP4-a]ANA49421.1 hypothetical protein CGG41_067 [Salmonella phage vB_SnwM_CGG4-1]